MAASRVEMVVLGLLAEELLHGYELIERYRSRGMGLWAQVGRASIYQALRRVEATGLVTGKAQEGDEGPDRRVYRITRTGRDRLREGLLDGFGRSEPYGVAAGPALGLAHLLSADEARKGVAQREQALAGLLAAIEAERARIPATPGPGAALARRMVDQQEALARAELDWLSGFRRDLGRLRR